MLLNLCMRHPGGAPLVGMRGGMEHGEHLLPAPLPPALDDEHFDVQDVCHVCHWNGAFSSEGNGSDGSLDRVLVRCQWCYKLVCSNQTRDHCSYTRAYQAHEAPYVHVCVLCFPSSSSMCWVCRDSPSFAGSLHDPWTHVICSRCGQLTCEACDRIDINGTSHVCKNCLGSDAHHDGEDGDCLPVAIDILLRGALREYKNSDARTGLYLLLIDNCERMRDFWHRQVSELPNTSLGPGDEPRWPVEQRTDTWVLRILTELHTRGLWLGAEVLQSVTAALECSIEVLDVEDCTIYTYGKGPVLGLLHYDHSHYWVAGRVADWWDWSARASASSNSMSVLD